MSKNSKDHERKEKELNEKLESLEKQIGWIIGLGLGCATCTAICLAILLVLSILGFFWPESNTNNMCPQSLCNSLSSGLSSAVSMAEWTKAERETRHQFSLVTDNYENINKSINRQQNSLSDQIGYVQTQLNNIQEGRCACNMSHFCMKSQCELLEKKIDQRVLGVCEDGQSIAQTGITVEKECSQYTVIHSGFYHITAEVGGVGRLSVHVDDVVIYSERNGQHVSIFEPLVKGDRLFFSVNGTKTTPLYSTVVLVSSGSGDPMEYLTKHRTRKDKLYSANLLEIHVNAAARGWMATLFLFLLTVIIPFAVVSAVVVMYGERISEKVKGLLTTKK